MVQEISMDRDLERSGCCILLFMSLFCINTRTCRRLDDAFVSTGFNNWKNALSKTGGLSKHDKSIRHKDALVGLNALLKFGCSYNIAKSYINHWGAVTALLDNFVCHSYS